jgi:hypothetical protein
VCGRICTQEEIQRKGEINAKSHEMRLELLYLQLDSYHDAVHAPGRIRTTAVSALWSHPHNMHNMHNMVVCSTDLSWLGEVPAGVTGSLTASITLSNWNSEHNHTAVRGQSPTL